MNLIYQFWSGEVPEYAKISRKWFESYAKDVGAKYLFLDNPKSFSNYGEYFNACRPIFDKQFHTYDKVLYVDMDIFPVKGLKENIFDTPCKGISMAVEPEQVEQRLKGWNRDINSKNDIKWSHIINLKFGSEIPFKDGTPEVYNSGVVLYTQEFLKNAHSYFIDINDYISAMNLYEMPRFYSLDQNYLHANAFLSNEFNELDCEWNRQLYFYGPQNEENRPIYDKRTKDTKFVHYQVRGRNILDEDLLLKRINTPAENW